MPIVIVYVNPVSYSYKNQITLCHTHAEQGLTVTTKH